MQRSCICLFCLLLGITQNLKAQSVADMWISIPEDVVPYLSLNQRKEMIEYNNIGVDTNVKNKFEGSTSISTLTDDYGKFILSESRFFEIVKLPFEPDSIFMVIDSYLAPEIHGIVSFYDKRWNSLSSDDKLQKVTIEELFIKSDTMSVKEYEDLIKLIIPEFLNYSYDSDNKMLEISVSLPLTTSNEKEQISSMLCKRRLKWKGNTFN